MSRPFLLLAALLGAGLCSPLFAAAVSPSSTQTEASPKSLAAPRERGWSASLLRSLEAPSPNQKTAARQSASAQEAAGEGGFVLRSYQLQRLRVGEGGTAQALSQALRRLLPQGSVLKEDVPSNSLHVLSSTAAQAAVWELLSSLDSSAVEGRFADREMAGQLKLALEKLQSLDTDGGRLREQLERVQEDLTQSLNASAATSERPALYRALWIASGIFVLVAWFLWRLLRRGRRLETQLARVASPTEAPAAHQLLQSHITRNNKEMQAELMSVLNTAAIRMEAWFQDQKQHGQQLALSVARQEEALVQAQQAMELTRQRLLEDNRSLFEKAGGRLEASAGRLEEGVRGLGEQQQRVEALADELQSTVRELDATRDRMCGLEGELRDRNAALDTARSGLAAREAELVRQQAKLAALTLILEEGEWPDSQESPPVLESLNAKPVLAPALEEGSETVISGPAANKRRRAASSVPAFVFLAPDSEEPCGGASAAAEATTQPEGSLALT